MSFDVGNSVANSGNLLSLIVGDGNTKLLLKLHDELYSVELISAEVAGETLLCTYFCCINAKLIDDDIFHFAFNFRHSRNFK